MEKDFAWYFSILYPVLMNVSNLGPGIFVSPSTTLHFLYTILNQHLKSRPNANRKPEASGFLKEALIAGKWSVSAILQARSHHRQSESVRTTVRVDFISLISYFLKEVLFLLTACLSLYLVLISFHLISNLKEATKEFTNFLIFCKIQIDD